MFDLNALITTLTTSFSPGRVFDWLYIFLQYIGDTLNLFI